jgi:hypothetical protein
VFSATATSSLEAVDRPAVSIMTPTDTQTTDTERTVRKDLDDADRTAGFSVEHYSSGEVARACHAEEGRSHD